MIISGCFLGYRSWIDREQNTKEIKILAEMGSSPNEAFALLPNEVKEKIKVPTIFPFEESKTKSVAQTKTFGKSGYSYEQYWGNGGKQFFFNVLNITPKADESYKKDPNYTSKKVKIYKGIDATYITGPRSEKLFWNENGFQYMIGSNSMNGKVDFYGPNKLVDIAVSMK